MRHESHFRVMNSIATLYPPREVNNHHRLFQEHKLWIIVICVGVFMVFFSPIIFPSSSSLINNAFSSSNPILLFSLLLCVLSSSDSLLPIIVVAHYFMFLRLQHFLSLCLLSSCAFFSSSLGLIIYHFTCFSASFLLVPETLCSTIVILNMYARTMKWRFCNQFYVVFVVEPSFFVHLLRGHKTK